MESINTHLVHLSGKIEIPEPLDEEKFVLVMGEFDFSKKTDTPNGDGTSDRTYTLFPTRIEVKQGENRLFGKPKRRGSQRLRGAIWHTYNKLKDPPKDFEIYYDNVINKLIVRWEEVLDFLGE